VGKYTLEALLGQAEKHFKNEPAFLDNGLVDSDGEYRACVLKQELLSLVATCDRFEFVLF
jgi:hypothetical protein